MTKEEYKFILDRIVENIIDDLKQTDKDDFSKGRKMVCYELLDIIKNEMEIRGESLAEYGIPRNLEKYIFG